MFGPFALGQSFFGQFDIVAPFVYSQTAGNAVDKPDSAYADTSTVATAFATIEKPVTAIDLRVMAIAILSALNEYGGNVAQFNGSFSESVFDSENGKKATLYAKQSKIATADARESKPATSYDDDVFV